MYFVFFFFFQAEDGIRDDLVTGVQTCALPICLGVLSEFLAPRVAHLHVVEVDRSLEEPLREALAPFANATLLMADAVRLDLAELEPGPNKVVANLPYGVAATVLLKSVAELPDVELWVGMV